MSTVYKCGICDIGFRYLRDLKTHLLVHLSKKFRTALNNPRKPFPCPLCGKKNFRDSHNLFLHYAFVHEKIHDFTTYNKIPTPKEASKESESAAQLTCEEVMIVESEDGERMDPLECDKLKTPEETPSISIEEEIPPVATEEETILGTSTYENKIDPLDEIFLPDNVDSLDDIDLPNSSDFNENDQGKGVKNLLLSGNYWNFYNPNEERFEFLNFPLLELDDLENTLQLQ